MYMYKHGVSYENACIMNLIERTLINGLYFTIHIITRLQLMDLKTLEVSNGVTVRGNGKHKFVRYGAHLILKNVLLVFIK